MFFKTKIIFVFFQDHVDRLCLTTETVHHTAAVVTVKKSKSLTSHWTAPQTTTITTMSLHLNEPAHLFHPLHHLSAKGQTPSNLLPSLLKHSNNTTHFCLLYNTFKLYFCFICDHRVLNLHHQASPVTRAPSMPPVEPNYIPPPPPLIQDYRHYYHTPSDLPGMSTNHLLVCTFQVAGNRSRYYLVL